MQRSVKRHSKQQKEDEQGDRDERKDEKHCSVREVSKQPCDPPAGHALCHCPTAAHYILMCF